MAERKSINFPELVAYALSDNCFTGNPVSGQWKRSNVGQFFSNVGMTVTIGGANTTFAGNVASSGLITTNNGIKFPAIQIPSADLNILDDYQEGAYTPILTASSGVTSGGTSFATFTKIGRVVTVVVEIAGINPNTLTGALRVSLPFQTLNTPIAYGSGVVRIGGIVSPVNTVTISNFTYPDVSETRLALYSKDALIRELQANDCTPSFSVAFTLTYFSKI